MNRKLDPHTRPASANWIATDAFGVVRVCAVAGVEAVVTWGTLAPGGGGLDACGMRRPKSADACPSRYGRPGVGGFAPRFADW
ncbi:hypothetical protein GCM10017607_14380 [Microbacterium thalassium]|nr:hypothetical protein GCM10017607_14380 [Microbacterium thalassium]